MPDQSSMLQDLRLILEVKILPDLSPYRRIPSSVFTGLHIECCAGLDYPYPQCRNRLCDQGPILTFQRSMYLTDTIPLGHEDTSKHILAIWRIERDSPAMTYVSEGSVLAIGILFIVLGTTAFIARFSARAKGKIALGIDDWLCLPALVSDCS